MKIDQLFESGDDLASQFAQMAKEKGMNVRVRGTPDQERQRTQDMLAQRRADQEKQSQLAGEKDFANLDQLEAEYAKMKDEYQSLGGSNWQYADREQNLSASERKARSMEDGLRALWSRIQRAKKYSGGVAEGSAHGYNVAKWYAKNSDQLKLTRWLRKEAGLEKDAPVYFDDADLVYGDKTIVPNALVNTKLTFNDLLTAVAKATGGQGKQNMGGVYREQGVAEGDALADFLAKGGKIHQLPYKKPRKADKTDYGSKHIGTLGGKGTKGKVTGKAANVGKVGKPVVSAESSHPDEKEDKALIRQMVKKQALKRENIMAKEQHEDHEISMATSELKNVYINAKKLFDIIKQRSEQEGLDAWQQSKITKASDYLNSVLTAIRGEPRR